MAKHHLKQGTATLARMGHLFTGYDWTGTAASARPAPAGRFALDPAADATLARRTWRARAERARQAVRSEAASDELHQRVSSWAHARVPGDPCIGSGC